jgi:hypothetical protein
VTVSGNQETGLSSPAGGGFAVGAIVTLQSLAVTDSTITQNHAIAIAAAGTDGAGAAAGGNGAQAVGGILATQGSQLTLTDSTVSANTAIGGAGGASASGAGGSGGNAFGGLYVIDNAPLAVTGSTFSDNTAQAGPGGAGAIGGAGGASYGGGLFSPDGQLTIVSSTFSRNVVKGGAGGSGSTGAGGAGGEGQGGGVAGGSRSMANSILNSTFYANRAEGGPGGPGSPAGAAALSTGGGVAEINAASMAIVSSTFADNVAGGPGPGYGGNLYDQPTPITIAQSIFDGGTASSGANCSIAAAETDLGHNLESSTPSQCGFSAANHDVIGSDPRLAPLTANGGAALTMALMKGSPAIGAAGTCLDYTQSHAGPLATDERGDPRSAPCDIGAFQTQPRGASGGVAPTISHVGESAKRWRVGKQLPSLAAARPPIGTTFRFSLNEPATIMLTFAKHVHGRKVEAGKLVLAGAHAGRNTIRFAGRLSRARRLTPGSYSVTITATGSGHRTISRPLRFTIVKR